jgi:hypothetical protein
MNIEAQLFKFAPYFIVLVAVNSVANFSSVPIGNITFWWILQVLTLGVFWQLKNLLRYDASSNDMRVITWYLFYNAISIFRGFFIAESYWDWKGFISVSLGLLLPIIAFSVPHMGLWQAILRFFVRIGLPLFLLLSIIISKDAYGFYLVPVTFLILFIPVLPLKGKLILIMIAVLVILSDLTARSNVIKFGVPFLLLLLYWWRNIIPVKMLEAFRIIFFITPYILFALAATETFNVFQMDKYLGDKYVEKKVNNEGVLVDESLTADTRTFLYEEVLATAKKHNSWIIGRSAARGNETEWFADIAEITGKKERLWNEAAILNVFTWSGLIGVFFFMLVFYRASYLAINRSNNIFCKMLGIFIAFRWVYAWVEDSNLFNLGTLFLWFMIGLCFSGAFRSLNNDEVTYWIRGVFDKRYALDRLQEIEEKEEEYLNS